MHGRTEKAVIIRAASILMLALMLIPAGCRAAQPSRDMHMLVQQYSAMLGEARSKGVDVSAAEELNRQSIDAFRSGDASKAESLITKAIEDLKSKGINPSLQPAQDPMARMSRQSAASSATPPSSISKTPLGISRTLQCDVNASYPFGIHAPFYTDGAPGVTQDLIVGYMRDLGVKWVRLIPPELEGTLSDLNAVGINVLGIVGGGPNHRNSKSNGDETRRIVSRYKSVVKYWQVGNEPDMMGMSAEDYFALLKSTYQALKSECPECKVVLGGTAFGSPEMYAISNKSRGLEYYTELMKLGAGGYFDVFDLHFAGSASGYMRLGDVVASYRRMMADAGVYGKPVWITEMSTHSGHPETLRINGTTLAFAQQSESEQAAAMIKMYVTGMSAGVSNMFWNLVIERHGFGGVVNGYYDNVGLVANPLRGGSQGTKLSYYAYRKMTAFFAGVDTRSIEITHFDGATYAYKFDRKGRSVWVAWTEREGGSSFVIQNVGPGGLIVTDAVPTASTGNAIAKDAASLYTSYVVKPLGSTAVSVRLDKGRVYFVQDADASSN